MSDEASGILEHQGGDDLLEEEAVGKDEAGKSPSPELPKDQSQEEDAGGAEPGAGGGGGSVARLDSYSPAGSSSGSRKSPRTLVVTPAPASEGGDPSTGRRVSFKPDDRDGNVELPAGLENNDLRVPAGRYTPSPISPSPTSVAPSASPFPSRPQQRRSAWRRRESEWVFRPLKLKFKVKELEELYKNYVYRQQQSLVCMACLIMFFLSVLVFIFFFAHSKFDGVPLSENRLDECSSLANLSFTYFDMADDVANYGELPLLVIFVFFSIVFAVIAVVIVLDRISYTRLLVYSVIVWAAMVLELYALFAVNVHRRASDQMGFLIFVLFVTYFMIPLGLRVNTVLSVSLCVLHLVLSTAVAEETPSDILGREFVANTFLLCGVNLVGIFYYYLADIARRKSFSETRRYIKALITIEGTKSRKDRLLRSILPKRLTATMADQIIASRKRGGAHYTSRKKGGAQEKHSEFRDLHVRAADNVSILFADIVGFTALSSKCSAQQLVHLLNQLFGKFDSLAEKNGCLRIKILGDCYYCVSGLLERRSDHAQCCIHMGLDMVKVIREVRVATGVSTLDMRVGVHTGRVLSGVLGQLKYQFDVWSYDVIVANHMESGGRPGQVHISHATKGFLRDNEFELTEGNGSSRDNFLKEHCVVTYLIQQESQSYLEADNDEIKSGNIDTAVKTLQWDKAPAFSEISAGDEATAFVTKFLNPSALRQKNISKEDRQANEQIKKMVYDKDRSRWYFLRVPQDLNRLTLHFRKRKEITDEEEEEEGEGGGAGQLKGSSAQDYGIGKTKYWGINLKEERAYSQEPDKAFKFYLATLLILFVIVYIVQAIMVPKSYVMLGTFLAGFIYYAVFLVLYSLHIFRHRVSLDTSLPVRISLFLIHNYFARLVIAIVAIAWIIIGAAINMSTCDTSSVITSQNVTDRCNCTTWDEWLDRVDHPSPDDSSCQYPQYFYHSMLLALIGSAIFIRLNWIIKSTINLVAIVLYLVVILATRPCLFDNYDKSVYGICRSCDEYPELKGLAAVVLVGLFVASVLLSRNNDIIYRMSFLWKQRTQREKEQKKNLEEVNQLLLESILPTKVSKYYMEEENNAGYYSESCECACVIFASIPEFWSMYSETEINQKGVEWLRLLNEIIGDFDDIIEKKKYRGKVEKIKTIGSTYMAATGLGENQPETEEEKVKQLNQNVVLMAHFAFELIRTLNRINREIFNDLKMRIGLNHGPVVAGVIGSQKPLYDIWGDTVNVASRMDSTGHLTKIQITEVTANILSSHGFVLEKRGSVPIKGKGELTTFFVVSEPRKS